MQMQTLMQQILQLGAAHAGLVKVKDIPFDPAFRQMCKQNACGMYGRSWMCPPYVGEISDLIAQAKTHKTALVYQTIDPLEDSYDFEGMMRAGERMNRLTQAIREQFAEDASVLFLGAGGCRICSKCARQEEKPCRFPEKALASLEAYGVHVSELARLAGMQYINGVNTVTYFGAVLMEKEL